MIQGESGLGNALLSRGKKVKQIGLLSERGNLFILEDPPPPQWGGRKKVAARTLNYHRPRSMRNGFIVTSPRLALPPRGSTGL